jgi:hypothetical protein
MAWVSTLTKLVITSSKASGILNQIFTCFTDDEIYSGWSSYIRNMADINYTVLPKYSNPDKLHLFVYEGEIFCLYYNTTGINIVQMFAGSTDNLIVEPEYAKDNEL